MEKLEREIEDLEHEIYNLHGKIDEMQVEISDLKCDIGEKEDQIKELERELEQAYWTGVDPVISDISMGDSIKIKEVMMRTLKELGIRFEEIRNG